MKGKTQPRKHKSCGTQYNDEKTQTTLFPTKTKKEDWYITTPKFERLRKKLLAKQKRSLD